MTSPALLGKTAVITGASRGLGEAIALRFAREGASLALIARTEADLAEMLQKLHRVRVNESQKFCAIAADLTQSADLDRVIKTSLRELGAIDILINNAATQGPIGPLESADWARWRDSFEVNLFAPARLCQLLIPSMRSRGRGKIINISGGGATSPRPDFSAYASAKCALVRLTETLALELQDARIDVNAVAPGAMNTRMLNETLAAGPQAASREFAQAMKRKSEGGAPPEKAADLVALLASSACDGITGKLISAVWDDWESLAQRKLEMIGSDLYTLRRVFPPVVAPLSTLSLPKTIDATTK